MLPNGTITTSPHRKEFVDRILPKLNCLQSPETWATALAGAQGAAAANGVDATDAADSDPLAEERQTAIKLCKTGGWKSLYHVNLCKTSCSKGCIGTELKILWRRQRIRLIWFHELFCYLFAYLCIYVSCMQLLFSVSAMVSCGEWRPLKYFLI